MKKHFGPLNFRAKVSVFCSLLSIALAGIYLFARIGFEDHTWYVSKLLGATFLIFHFPFLIQESFARTKDVNPLLLSIALLLAISLVGFLNIPGIGVVFGLAGYVLFAYYFIRLALSLINNSNKLNLIIYGSFALLMVAWIVSRCWATYTLSPIYLERAVGGVLGWGGWYGTDTLFHVALSQMIKTYHIPTTGIDGLPFTYYHFGSHFLFAGLSSFLNIPLIIIYNAGYAIFIVPLLFYSILLYAIQLRDQLNSKKYSYLGLTIFLIFSFYFLELIKHRYSGGALGSTFLLSESTTVSIIVLMFCYALIHFYWENKQVMSKPLCLLFIYLFIPGSLFFLGLVKNSTFFVTEGLLVYLFVRFKAYTKMHHNFFFAINAIMAPAVLWLTMETLPFGLRVLSKQPEDSADVGLHYAFYNESFDLLSFVLLFCFTIVVVILNLIVNKITSISSMKNGFKSYATIPAEIVLILSLLGILPTVFLQLYPPNYMYFLIVQSFVGIVFVMAYITDDNFKWVSGARWGLKIVFLTLLLVAFNYVSISIRKDLKHHFFYGDSQTRTELTRPHKIEYPKGLFDYYPVFSKIRSEAKLDTLRSNPFFKIVSELKKLDALSASEKRKSMIYVDLAQIQLPKVTTRTVSTWVDYSVVNDRWMMMRYDLPLLVPALTGIAMIDGMPCNYPNLGGHGYAFYPDRVGCDDHKINNSILEKVRERGFKQVFYFDENAFEFKKIDVGQ